MVYVVDRPDELAGDRATIDDAARHAVRAIARPTRTTDPQTPIAILYANVPVPYGPDGAGAGKAR